MNLFLRALRTTNLQHSFVICLFYSEISDFLSPEEADHITDVAYGDGFYKSDIHLDPVAKDHAKTLRSTEGKEKRNSDIDRLMSC